MPDKTVHPMRSLARCLTFLSGLVIASPALPQPLPLPNIIYPDPLPSDDQGAPKTNMTVTGTGFFVASDGTLLTAAHVVTECRQTRIASQLVKPADARLLATDAAHDIALLRAAFVTPPAVLPVGRPAAPAGRLFVLGYAASGGPLVPSETWATLANDRLPPAQPEFSDPRRMIWPRRLPSITAIAVDRCSIHGVARW
jgi:S1-C subfamily serine protease